jgi:uncharacterized protein YjbI with pentapeptide repeats
MANEEHVALLKQGVAAWNAWRDKNPNIRPDLSGANLIEANLIEANLIEANLIEANLIGANLGGAHLGGANLLGADLDGADLDGANLSTANLSGAHLLGADLGGADLRGASLGGADLGGANLSRANLSGAHLRMANLSEAKLIRAKLIRANLYGAHLRRANLNGANLNGADLNGADLIEADLGEADLQAAVLIGTDFSAADLTGCRIYGVSAWGLKLERTKQQNLVITRADEPAITVDNIEVAQFIYLLLHNEKIRDVIDTIGKKGVLLLGRFTEGRMVILERLREKLRDLGFVPIVFNFDKPETKDYTETVRLLCNLSHFVIVDITNPRSAPLELQATVPDYMVPFAPILQEGEKPFAMFVDLQNKYDWVLQPVIAYSSVDRLIEVLKDEVVKPAEAKFDELLARRTNQLRVKNV